MPPVLPKITDSELKAQVEAPDHVYIELRPGVFFRHAWDLHERESDYPSATFKGDKVRFTRLAATRMLAEYGPKARLVPCG